MNSRASLKLNFPSTVLKNNFPKTISCETISAFLSERITANDFPSAVYAVAEGGEIVFADALGNAVCQTGDVPTRAATIETIYDLASLTKPLVTGLITALFVERGQTEIEAPVAKYLAEFNREDKRALTVRQLLTHTSGLQAWGPLYALTDFHPEKTLEVIAALPLEYAPDSKVEYSDMNFIALGFLLERVSGLRLDALAAREIFAPLDLHNTCFNPPAVWRRRIAASESNGSEHECLTNAENPRAQGYCRERRGLIWGEVHDCNARFLGGAAGHAGLFSNAFETVRIAEQFTPARTRLLKPETCALFRQNMTPGLNEARSFAWQLAATPKSTASDALAPDSFGHLGFTGTSCWIDAARAGRERIFVLLTNRTHNHAPPFVNINAVRRRFHQLAVAALDAQK
jgi:CubicO group peptidase (beta-lactamase class C family)